MSKQPTTNRKSNEQASTGSRPTHRVFAVSDALEGQKAFWHDIGAAWELQDGILHRPNWSSAARMSLRLIVSSPMAWYVRWLTEPMP
jgi:hypothetical protein